jgi:putative PEP-CTERM system TPR-repeat lipoprotein
LRIRLTDGGLSLVATHGQQFAAVLSLESDNSMTVNLSSFTTPFSGLVRLGVLGLAATLLMACGQPSPEKLLASAKEYLAKGEGEAAVIELKNLLQQAPNSGEARLLLGEALLQAGDVVSAEKELGRALELKQPHEKVVPPYALALLAQGKNQAVVNEVTKYKLFNPGAVATTQTALGDAYLRLGNTSRARDAYAAAIVAVPGHPRARLGEAIIVAGEGQIDDALQRIGEVIATDPKLAEAHTFRSDMLLAKGDRAGARKALEDAVAADAKFVAARLALVRILTEDNELDAARSQLEQTRKLAPRDLRVNYYDAALALRGGELEKARQQLQQVLKFLPDHVPSLVLSASVELRAGQPALAEEHLRRAVARVPAHLPARRMLAAVQLRLGQPRQALDTLRPLVEKGMPQDPQLLLLAGETYLANGDVKQASTFFDAAAKTGKGQDVAAKTRLGQIALATGRGDEGFRELEAASELDAGQYQADLAIITGHLRRNEIDKAMAAVQTLERKQPKNPLTFQMYGVTHLAKRDVAAARRSFEKALELQANYLPAAQQLGMLDLAEKRPEDARKRFEAMIAKDGKNDQLYLALAEFQVRTGVDRKVAAETLQRGIAANPQSAAAREALINFHLGNRDAKAALAAAQDALGVMPGDPRILYAAGSAQEAAGEHNQAIESFNKLAGLQPQSPAPLLRLAALYLALKQNDKAIEALRRLQKIAPGEQTVRKLVQVYLVAGRPDEALKEARALQQRQPKLAIGRALEGEVHLAQGKLPEAERAFRDALQLEPKADVVAIRLHGVLIAGGKTREADALARKWIAENPNDVTMRLYLGERELAARNLKASAAHYQAAIAIDANNALALNNLAWISGELNDPKALEYAERALKLAPNNAEVHDTHGMLLLKKGEVDKALAAIGQARRLAPERRDVQLHQAKALLKAGRKDEARKELEALQAVKENFAGKDEVAGLLKGL